jgi:Zn-finger nucleic acid-binding protein
VLLVTVGLGVTGIVAAAVSAVVLAGFCLTLEHGGERRLPWSRGGAGSEPRSPGSIVAVFRGLNQVLWSRTSVVLIAIMFTDGLVSGYGHALMPIAAIKLFGYTTPEWSQQVAVMGLIGAGVALAFGPMIDRFGAKRMLLVTVSLVALHAFLLAKTQMLWQDTLYVKAMLSIWIMLGPVTMVCVIAIAMAICATASSATQFAVYMSVANLGSAAGSKLYGAIAEGVTYADAYVLLALLTLATIAALLFYRHRPEAPGHAARVSPRRYTVGSSFSGAGMYWSGAMRCPKCRSDMDQIEIDGLEIDRCSSCRGLWFDAGELNRLRNRRAAAAIDIGDPKTGKVQNKIDRYRCPRCGGPMIRMVDAKQPHIWYENCGSCHGSYFDAGEFTDLATVSLSDFFRRWTTTERV